MYGGGYGGGGYGGGGYGSSYNRLGSYGGQTTSSPFVRRAEESSQAAFQSVESIVHAFGSISMMLESTHFAMLNTFRAVLGAADHFSRLKSSLIGAAGAIAIFKTIKTLCKKLLYILGLIRNTGVENEVWTEAHSSVVAAASGEGKDRKATKS
jgi:peroxin-13